MSVVVPMFNGTPHLRAFGESLNRALLPNSEVILIDDGSTDNVFAAMPDLPRATKVVRLRNHHNLGYSGAVNRGVAETTGEIIVQLNTDLVLDPECITAMVSLVERTKDVGIVGSKLVYPTTGRTQSVGMAFGQYSKRHVFRHLAADHPLCRRTRQVQIATGATVTMTRRVFEAIGPLDEELYNHNVDLDHCMRASSLGLRNFVCAESVAHHWRGQSGHGRLARVEAVDAAFWSKWGGTYEIDLGRFIDEALDDVLDQRPDLADMPFTLIDLTKSADQSIALERLELRWKGLVGGMHSHRQMHNSSVNLWLPMLLPHWLANDPAPFIYLVDSYQDLVENALWFQLRRGIVREELIIDLAANVQCASELFASTGHQ